MSDFKFNFKHTRKYKSDLITFLKGQSNVEIGGSRLYDGSGSHYMQNPYEIAELIFFLKLYEKKKNIKIKDFLEIGFSAGINNSIFNKFFNFNKNVVIDVVQPVGISFNTFYANLRFKNLTLLCGDSKNKKIIKQAQILGNYDLIFIDGGHDYKTVRSDFEVYSKLLAKNGVIVLHDIKSNVVKDVPKFWKELKNKSKSKFKFKEIFKKGFKMECGLGLVFFE